LPDLPFNNGLAICSHTKTDADEKISTSHGGIPCVHGALPRFKGADCDLIGRHWVSRAYLHHNPV